MPPPPTCASTPTTRWTGCRGGPRPSRRARSEDKPLLVSIGYSACHWCHVMAHDPFEDPEVAAQMNRDFVCVKVDREERPDVDAIYMDAVQAMTGGGGWPLNAFATPDQVPFYAGTYYPPQPGRGMPRLDPGALLGGRGLARPARGDRGAGPRAWPSACGARRRWSRAATSRRRRRSPARWRRCAPPSTPCRRLDTRAEVPRRLDDRAAARPRARRG